MQWRNFLLTGAFFIILLMAHACSPDWQDTDKLSVPSEVTQAEPLKPIPLPILFVEAPKPEPKPKPKPKPVVKKASKKGSGKQTKGGINVVGRFDCSVEFYLDVMRREGARLLLYEKNGPAYYDIHEDGGITSLDGLSGDFAPVARNLTLDHPQSGAFIRRAEQRFGPGSYEVIMLIPTAVQERIDHLVEQVLPPTGAASGTVSVRYQNSAGTLLVEFEEAVLNGETVALNRRVAF